MSESMISTFAVFEVQNLIQERSRDRQGAYGDVQAILDGRGSGEEPLRLCVRSFSSQELRKSN